MDRQSWSDPYVTTSLCRPHKISAQSKRSINLTLKNAMFTFTNTIQKSFCQKSAFLEKCWITNYDSRLTEVFTQTNRKKWGTLLHRFKMFKTQKRNRNVHKRPIWERKKLLHWFPTKYTFYITWNAIQTVDTWLYKEEGRVLLIKSQLANIQCRITMTFKAYFSSQYWGDSNWYNYTMAVVLCLLL